MSTEKPQKRLVGWVEYMETIGTKGATYSFAGVCACGGLGLLLVGVITIAIGILACFLTNLLGGVLGVIFGAGIGGFGLLGLWIARIFFQEARHTPPVALLTKYSAKHLPESETLVRASDRPSTRQEAELLRAARQGPETPSEQLLRATQESRPDV